MHILNCTSLATLVLPGTLRTVKSYAFYGCSSLATLHYGGDDFSGEVGFYNEKTGEGKIYLRPFNVSTGLFTSKNNGTYGGFGEITAICPTFR